METKQVIDALGALAQETRLAIYRLLMQRGPEGLSAGAIAEALSLPASSLSFHLAHLSRAGLVAQRRESRSLIYAVDFGGMNELMAYLTENCCGGNAAACAPVACTPDCASPAGTNPSNRSQSA
jgi:DNA-binding transcriptional ArsR family regulator